MKILLAIHQEEVWESLSRRLKRRGFDVVVAPDGREAIDKSRTEAPDIVVIEVDLPMIHGWTAIRMMRDDPATAALPIVASVGIGGAGEHREEAIAARPTDYSPWPIDFSNSLLKIEQYGPGS